MLWQNCLIPLTEAIHLQSASQSAPGCVNWASPRLISDASPGSLGVSCGQESHLFAHILESRSNLESLVYCLRAVPKTNVNATQGAALQRSFDSHAMASPGVDQ